jgi:hypothetical protein
LIDSLTIPEAAAILKKAGHEKSQRRLQDLCLLGRIKAKKSGVSWMIDPDSLAQYIHDKTHRHQRMDKIREEVLEIEIEKPNPLSEYRVAPRASDRRYIFTSAQENTPVHTQFWDNLNVYAEYLNKTDIIVGPFSYKKRLSFFADMFDPVLNGNLYHNEIVLPRLRFGGHFNIKPTAVSPLSGLLTYSQGDWGIFPHPKIALASIPTSKSNLPKLVMTTGAVTLPHYDNNKAGLKAEFHHVIGAVIVEYNDDNEFFCRQLLADDEGTFYDLDVMVKNGKVYKNQRVEAIVWGDIHLSKADQEIFLSSFGWDHNRNCSRDSYNGKSILDVLQPKTQFFHDLLDFEARNHHNIADSFHWAEMKARGTDCVEKEIQNCAKFLHATRRGWCKSVVVESNHDMALNRWLKEANVRYDPTNVLFYHKCQVLKHEAIVRDEQFNIFDYVIHNSGYAISDISFVDEDGGYTICGDIECGTHGHRGSNGSRGSAMGYSKMAEKMCVGHSHSATILDGVYVAGVSARLHMGYNTGPSSWSHSHIVIYPNGKRAIITLSNSGAWRA